MSVPMPKGSGKIITKFCLYILFKLLNIIIYIYVIIYLYTV